MRVTLAQLEAFFWVARLGKVREAAEQLNIAQPTVSLRLRDFEQAVGAAVFERAGRTLRLTPKGTAMLEHAEVILGEVGRMGSGPDRQEIGGTIRFGSSETFAVSGLPDLLRIIAEEHPALRIELSVGPSRGMIDDLHERRLDLAVVVNPTVDARLKIVPLGVQQSTWAASPDFGLPRTIRPADVQHLTILVNSNPSPNFHQTMAWFAGAAIAPHNLSVCNTVPSVVAHLAEAGVGIGIFPNKLIETHVKAGTLVALECSPRIENAYLCVAHRANEAEPAVDVVLETVRRSLAGTDLLEPI